MKRILLPLAAFGLLFSTLVFGSEAARSSAGPGQMGTSSAKKEKAPKLKTLKGTISKDGKSFVADKSQKSWTIINPEAVEGHEGHHVRLSAHVYPDKDEIHVMSVKMMTAKKEKNKNSMQ